MRARARALSAPRKNRRRRSRDERISLRAMIRMIVAHVANYYLPAGKRREGGEGPSGRAEPASGRFARNTSFVTHLLQSSNIFYAPSPREDVRSPPVPLSLSDNVRAFGFSLRRADYSRLSESERTCRLENSRAHARAKLPRHTSFAYSARLIQ